MDGLRCPQCRYTLAKPIESGDTLLRGKYMMLTKSGIELVCPRCRNRVEMPAAIKEELRKALLLRVDKPLRKGRATV